MQISADALRAYVDAIEQTFGADIDFGEIVKTYEHDDSQNAERKYLIPPVPNRLRRLVRSRLELGA